LRAGKGEEMHINKITLFFSLLTLIIGLLMFSCATYDHPKPEAIPAPAPAPAPAPVEKAIKEKLAGPKAKKPVPVSEIPQFPWPPPRASALENIPKELLRKLEDKAVTLSDVDLKLSNALEKCGYYEKSYFAVPDGFALVTRLEQINPDGTSKELPDRWSIKVKSGNFSLYEYIKALFTAKPGHFRIIVFIITPHPFSQTDVTIGREEAIVWLSSGLNKLPRTIGVRNYSEEYTCTALIYEFEKYSYKEDPETKMPSHLSGRTHLEKAKIWKTLEE
jgi:hypothetical protein